MQKGDIQFVVEDTIFNYRVVVLLNTPDGYIFEKSSDGFLFTVGGKASINENSSDTIKRELMEEIGLKCTDLKLVALIENFFVWPSEGGKYHELSLVYRVNIDISLKLSELKSSNPRNMGFVAIKPEDFNSVVIKPSVLPKIILENKDFVHIINKEV
mgnify:CR=1 FL=1